MAAIANTSIISSCTSRSRIGLLNWTSRNLDNYKSKRYLYWFCIHFCAFHFFLAEGWNDNRPSFGDLWAKCRLARELESVKLLRRPNTHMTRTPQKFDALECPIEAAVCPQIAKWRTTSHFTLHSARKKMKSTEMNAKSIQISFWFVVVQVTIVVFCRKK